MSDAAITIEGLHFSYGRTKVLGGVDLEVPTGSIFGFLGRNGAGKTTTIKILMGLMRADSGTCRVSGLDCSGQTMKVRQAVGYMAEDQRMFGWMRVGEIIKWVSSFYKQWDEVMVKELLEMMELSLRSRVRSLSKGQNSRLALLLALGHRPGVVILDDPTLGLDPIARKEFLRNVITLLQSNGVTVFFSSHLLYEIEPVADYVAILKDGVIVKSAKTDELRESVKRVIVRGGSAEVRKIAGLLDVEEIAGRTALTVEDYGQGTRDAVGRLGCEHVEEIGLNLDEIFEAYVIGNRGEKVAV